MTGKQEGPYKGEETKVEEDKVWQTWPEVKYIFIFGWTIPLSKENCLFFIFFIHLNCRINKKCEMEQNS